MPGLSRTIFPHVGAATSVQTYGSQANAGPAGPGSSPHIAKASSLQTGPCQASNRLTHPSPPSTLAIPEDWVEDHDYLDLRRSIGNLSCPRFVASSAWAREKGIAGLPVMQLHPAHLLYQGMSSYWLRWLAHGRETYFVVCRTKAEMVLTGELLTRSRSEGVDLESAALNHAVQSQSSQAKNVAMKSLAHHLVECLKQKLPVETDQESQNRIRELESQIGDLQQQLLKQRKTTESTLSGDGALTSPAPSTPAAAKSLHCSQSPLGSSPPGDTSSPAPKASQPLATPGQPHRQLPLSFGSQSPSKTSHQPTPSSLMQPPTQGSPWLAANLPAKFQEREIKSWISALALNERRKQELLDWLKQVESWIEDQTDDGFIDKIRRVAVIWGVPVSAVQKLQKLPLARLMAVGSYMER